MSSPKEALSRYSSPFHRHLSFFDHDNDGIIHYSDSLRGNLSIGLDFPVAATMAFGYHIIYGNTRSAIFGPFNPINIEKVHDKRTMLENIQLSEIPLDGMKRSEVSRAAISRGVLNKAHVWGLWALAADGNGMLAGQDIELYQVSWMRLLGLWIESYDYVG